MRNTAIEKENSPAMGISITIGKAKIPITGTTIKLAGNALMEMRLK